MKALRLEDYIRQEAAALKPYTSNHFRSWIKHQEKKQMATRKITQKSATTPAKRAPRTKVRTEAKRTLEQMTEDYAKMTDAQRAAVWQAGRSEGESVKQIRLTRTGHGPTAALREWHRLVDAGLLVDPMLKRGRPAKKETPEPAKKAPAKRRPTEARKAAAPKAEPKAPARKRTARKAVKATPEAKAS